MAHPPSYRQWFAKDASASNYDEWVYRTGSSAEILWRVEAWLLRALAQELLSGRQDAAYLDFACGTGRVLSLLEDLPDSALGIDVSAAMLERAKARCRTADFLCIDVTQPGAEIEGNYDLITCFRFLTNAEPTLREAVLRQLYLRLKNDGTLLINTHSNPWSYRLFLLPYHWLKDRLRGRPLVGYLSNRQARRDLEAAGFRVKRIIGMGFVPQKLRPLIPLSIATKIEESFAGKALIQRFGINQLFVCVKD